MTAGSVPLGRILGIPVRVSWSVVIVSIVGSFVVATNTLPRVDDELGLWIRLLLAVATVALFLASILAHEFGHAIAARRHGISTSSIRLWIFGGVAALSSVARTPKAEFQIAAAGPAVNGTLTLLFAGLTAANRWVDGPGALGLVLVGLAILNGLLTLTNLIPAAPLDGVRVLTSVLWSRTGRAEQARVISARCGLVLSASVISFGFLEMLRWGRAAGLYTVAIGIFLGVSAQGDLNSAAIRRRLAGSVVADILIRSPRPVHDSLSLSDLHRLVPVGEPSRSLPVQRWEHETIGYVSTASAGSVAEPDRSWTSVGRVMTRSDLVPRAWTTERVLDALERHGTEQPQMLCIDPASGLPIGTVTPDQFRHLMIRPTFWGNDRRPARTGV
jgi:Zn-dependent protease